MRPIDADTLKLYMCNKCEERSICEYYDFGCSTMADIDEQPTLGARFVEQSVDDIKHRDLVDEGGKELSE